MSISKQQKAKERRIALLRKCAAEGLSQVETAEKTGIRAAWISRDASENGIKFPTKKRKSPRSDLYRECAARGMTRREAADHCGVTLDAITASARANPDIVFVDGIKGRPSTGGADAVNERPKRPDDGTSRFEVSGNIVGVGLRKHVIRATDQDAAWDRFDRSYPGEYVPVSIRNLELMSDA